MKTMDKVKGTLIGVVVMLMISFALNVKFAKDINALREENQKVSQSLEQAKKSRQSNSKATVESSKKELSKNESSATQSSLEKRASNPTEGKPVLSEKDGSKLKELEQYRKVVVPALEELNNYNPDTKKTLGDRMRPYLADDVYKRYFEMDYGNGEVQMTVSEPQSVNVYYGNTKDNKMTGIAIVEYRTGGMKEDARSNMVAIMKATVDLATNKISQLDQIDVYENFTKEGK